MTSTHDMAAALAALAAGEDDDARAAHVDRLVVVEFDVPDLAAGSHELYESLATRYELAVTEQGDSGAPAIGITAVP